MATNYSSPTANLFDLLKPEDDKKSKQPTKQPAAKPGKKLTPLEEAEKQRQAKEAQKMEAALVNQHEEEARDQGFKLNAPTTSGKANPKQTSHLSRAEWEAKKAKGEALSAPEAKAEPQQQQQREPRNNNNNNNRGNRNFDNPSEIKEQRQPNNRNFDRQNQGDNHQERRGPKPGREFDRHSQAQTGRKYNEKRAGGGKFNLGNAEAVLPVADVHAEEEKHVAVVSEPASTDASAVSAVVDEKKPEPVPDPDDEGFGKKTLDEYEKQRIAEAEALAKLVGTVERRELDKKIDLSKCIEADKHDDKLTKHSKARVQTGNASAKPKAKTLDLNEFVKTEGGTPPQLNQPRRGGPYPGNKNIPRGRNQFPAIGEEPQPRSNQGYRSEQSENQNNYNNGSDNNNNGQKSNYQGQRNNRPPRQPGQGVQQGQGQQTHSQGGPRIQGQGGQRPQGQGRQQGQGQGQGQGQRQQGQGQSRGNQGQGRSQGTA